MENKIEFNWEKYQSGLYDVVTRDGRKVEQLTLFDCSDKYPLTGVVNSDLLNWTSDGNFNYLLEEDVCDLFLIPKEKEDHFADVGKMVIPELKGVLMEVSDYKDFKVSCEEMVLGTYKGIFITDVGEWKYARPIKEVKEVWLNIFEDNGKLIVGQSHFDSKEEAIKFKSNNVKYIKTIRITNEKE